MGEQDEGNASAITEAVEALLVEERAAALERAVSSISHALGTPLQVIAGRAALIRADEASAGAHENARIIEGKVAEVTQMLRALLSFSRGDAGTDESADCRRVVGEVLRDLQELARERGVELSAGDLTSVRCEASRRRLRQGLRDLVSAGIHAARRGASITVSVERPGADVPGAPELPPDRGRFVVRCEGVTIPARHLEKPLEPWYVSGGVVDRAAALRLAVAYGVVRRLGGAIQASTEDEEVTVFEVDVPALPEQS